MLSIKMQEHQWLFAQHKVLITKTG